VNGSVFSVIEAYESIVLLCKIFDFHHAVWFVFDTKDLCCTFSVIKIEQHNNFCKHGTVSVKIVFQSYIDALWHLIKLKLCYLEGSPIESEIKYNSNNKTCFLILCCVFRCTRIKTVLRFVFYFNNLWNLCSIKLQPTKS
jgi:hypothetical protein